MKTWQLATLWAIVMASPWYAKKLPKWVAPTVAVCAALGMAGFLIYTIPWQYTVSFVAAMAVLCNAHRYPKWMQVIVGMLSAITIVALVGYVLYALCTGQLSMAEINEINRDFPYRK